MGLNMLRQDGSINNPFNNMAQSNNDIIIHAGTHSIRCGKVLRIVTDAEWEQFITPVLFPMWDSDKDKLITYKYLQDPTGTVQVECEKTKYVRNHTTGEYFWKNYLFSEVDQDTIDKFNTELREAFDAMVSVEIETVDEKFKFIVEQKKDLSLSRVRTWKMFLLWSCDWTMLEDAPLTDEEKGMWRTYRQKIRDLTTQFQKKTQVLASISVPIDPQIYKNHYLPYNTAAAPYLESDDQWISFPRTTSQPGSVNVDELDVAMNKLMKCALEMRRPSANWHLPNISAIGDPLEYLLAEIEQKQALVDEIQAADEAGELNT
tara:strand:- start:464 stop:1417 length:954 start_codon:yes stop_codon:yes gene_type:complete